MRYQLRDPQSGKFVKTERINWKEVKIMTTIDNESHQDVTSEVREEVKSDLPGLIMSDESTIRSTFQKFVDGVVSLSSYARTVDMLESKMKGLEVAIEEAHQRVLAANQERDEAKAEAAQAVADARMAREAYTIVANERTQLTTQLEMANRLHDDLRMELSNLRGANNQLATELWSTKDLLEVAREERDRFREQAGNLQSLYEDEQLRNIDFEETKEKLATTEAALTICAENTAHARALAGDRLDRIQDLERECSGLHSKVNSLEDDNARQGSEIERLRSKLDNVRHVLD